MKSQFSVIISRVWEANLRTETHIFAIVFFRGRYVFYDSQK
jgi:hypothetical protein